MEPGTKVEVRSKFDRSWSRGFEIVELVPAGAADDGTENGASPAYRVRRRSDGEVLPVTFPAEDLREEKKGRSMWWY